MNRQQFLQAAQEFLEWAGKLDCDETGHLALADGHIGRLQVRLDIPLSAKVPRPVAVCRPLHELTTVYSWRAQGMRTGDFAETRSVVAMLSGDLHAGMKAKSATHVMQACKEILRWGGDRNPAVGATSFLGGLPSIVSYLDAVKRQCELPTAVVLPAAGALGQVLAMNSMLTKVHAFNSDDGLPIYDSRVAGAIATVVETWRMATRRSGQPLIAALAFPAVGGGGPRRHVRRRYAEGRDPGTLHYVAKHSPVAVLQAREWASAKVRLGWLLEALLRNPSPLAMRSLEACLFMAGYDCAGINPVCSAAVRLEDERWI